MLALDEELVDLLDFYVEHIHPQFPQGGKRPGGETGSPLLIQCVMRRRTGTSAPSALPVILMAAKNFLSTNRKSTFLFLFLSHQWRIFKSLFDAIGPKCNTFKCVVMMLK